MRCSSYHVHKCKSNFADGIFHQQFTICPRTTIKTFLCYGQHVRINAPDTKVVAMVLFVLNHPTQIMPF